MMHLLLASDTGVPNISLLGTLCLEIPSLYLLLEGGPSGPSLPFYPQESSSSLLLRLGPLWKNWGLERLYLSFATDTPESALLCHPAARPRGHGKGMEETAQQEPRTLVREADLLREDGTNGQEMSPVEVGSTWWFPTLKFCLN